MSMINKIKIGFIGLLTMAFLISGVLAPAKVFAATITCPDGTQVDAPGGGLSPDERNSLCAGHNSDPATAETEAPKFVKSDCQGGDIKAGAAEGSSQHCGILDILTMVIKLLSGLVGVVVVAMIIIGGIQYSASAGEAQGVAAAKKRIISAILALVLYSFMFALLQYLIPGGVIQ